MTSVTAASNSCALTMPSPLRSSDSGTRYPTTPERGCLSMWRRCASRTSSSVITPSPLKSSARDSRTSLSSTEAICSGLGVAVTLRGRSERTASGSRARSISARVTRPSPSRVEPGPMRDAGLALTRGVELLGEVVVRLRDAPPAQVGCDEEDLLRLGLDAIDPLAGERVGN